MGNGAAGEKKMELDKIRNLSDDELVSEEKTSAEQLFRLRFQVSLGQNDGVKKLRELRKGIARIKTVARERKLGIERPVKQAAAPAKKAAAKKTVAKKSAPKKKAVTAGEEAR
jgi:large subunit ribosomal protein L29